MCLMKDGPSGGSGAAPKVVYRKDYKVPPYLFPKVQLNFQLDADKSTVESTIEFAKNPEATWAANDDSMVLDAEEIDLVSVALNGEKLQEGKDFVFDSAAHHLTLHKVPKSGSLQIVNTTNPKKNTALSGLYYSDGILCTQCEAEGFRRITPFLDRPDVMSAYTVRVEADKKLYPVLLSNGNVLKEEHDLPNNRHSVSFVDKFLKPCYLFCIIAGDLSVKEDSFEREKGGPVSLQIYSEKKFIDQMDWAMQCMKNAMKWDEEVYGRVYDLDVLRLVCLADFNAGAMENKSLLTFNVSCIVASKDTATDSSYAFIAGCVAHEYFHNWSGDRVTVRDWFQITLKEGFTNFRDHCFSEDNFGYTSRISDISDIKSAQFAEDASAMSHSIRPESYVAIDNFYTSTIYGKGAEVIRMYRCLFGAKGYRKGTDHYFDTYDGKAVSCDEFRKAMAEANEKADLTQFENWYLQKGTPRLEVLEKTWDEAAKTFTLKIKQHLSVNAEPGYKPYHMPVAIGLIGKKSKRDVLPDSHDILKHTYVLSMKEVEEIVVFENIEEDCVVSLLRDFSAPVIVMPHLSDEDLSFLMAYDTDAYNMWDAGQSIMRKVVLERANALLKDADNSISKLAGMEISTAKAPALPDSIIVGTKQTLQNRLNDNGLVALSLNLPPIKTLYHEMTPHAEPLALHYASEILSRQIAEHFKAEALETFTKLHEESKTMGFEISNKGVARRKLQNKLLELIVRADQSKAQFALDYAKNIGNYNDRVAGYAIVLNFSKDAALRKQARDAFYESVKGLAHTLDTYFQVCVTARETTMDDVRAMAASKDFKGNTNPNRFHALCRYFAGNTTLFHNPTGEGYTWLAEQVLAFDKVNAYSAAIAAKALVQFDTFSPERRELIVKTLKYMSEQQLTKHTYEVVTNGLKVAAEVK